MNWKLEAEEKLRRYPAMRQAIRSIPEEIKRLEEQANTIRAARTDTVSSHGGVSRGEDRLLNNMAERQELEWALENADRWLKNTDRALKTLSREERTVLSRMLIYPEEGAAQRLCMDLGVESSSIYRRRDNALRKFTLALYGSLES